MQTLHAALLGLRLLLATLALAGWLGPAAAMGRGAPPPAAHLVAVAATDHGHDEARPGAPEVAGHHGAGHDATACCAAACGPAVAPVAACLGEAREPRRAVPRAAPDRFPPGFEPAWIEPPPRTASF